MKRRALTFFCTIMSLALLFGITAYAEEDATENDTIVEDSVEDVIEDVIEDVVDSPSYRVIFNYALESTTLSGISYETYSDAVLNEFGFKIIDDLPMGHVIFDDSDTPYIDGIRINGEYVSSLKYAVTDTTVTEYVVTIKTVYADGILGDIARMSDGTYDWAKLLENPLVLLQLFYYAAAIISLIGGAIIAATGKKTKAKTSDEIANSVTDAAKMSLVEIKQQVTETVIQEATPILNQILSACENVVKAVTLTTSKSKDAPLALLDVLHSAASTTDTTGLIDQIRQNVISKIDEDEAARTANVEMLQSIGARASTPAEADIITVEEDHASEPKSVF